MCVLSCIDFKRKPVLNILVQVFIQITIFMHVLLFWFSLQSKRQKKGLFPSKCEPLPTMLQ